MTFTFLHAADLHLGSPLLGLSQKDADMAKRFASASRDAFSDLVTLAIDRGVAFVIIAGDIYDGEWKDTSIGLFFNREVSRLARHNIAVYTIRGNHDADSVVTKSLTLPDNVNEFSSRKVETKTIEHLKVALHGRSFPHRSVDENWARTYPAPVPGYVNIGVLHTSCDGRPGHDNYAPCTIGDLTARGYDYFALGHVHEFEILSRDPWVVFPGNLQGRSIRECGAKGAVLVHVDDSHITQVERVYLDRARFADCSLDLTGISDDAAALAEFEKALSPVADSAEGRLLAVRVHMRGETDLHRAILADPARWRDEVQAAAHRLHEDIWLEKLHIATRDPITPSHDEAADSIDLAALLSECRNDTDLQRKIADDMALLKSKLPGGLGAEFSQDDLPALLAEAEALILGRATGLQASLARR